MALINLTRIKAGVWTKLEGGQVPTLSGPVAVPFARFAEESESLFSASRDIGAIVPTDTPYAALAPFVAKLAFVVINFPSFSDGRGFSLAVRLRKDLGFKGEIRATGHVIPDQALYLLRAGFDTLDIPDAREAAFVAALDRFSAFYQSDFTGQVSVAHLRHRANQDTERKAS